MSCPWCKEPMYAALKEEPRPGWAIYCNNEKCPVRPIGKETHQSLQEAMRYANRPGEFAQTLENVEWLSKILLQQEVGGSDDDIDRVWKLIAMRPPSMRTLMAKARRLLVKIRQRARL